MQATALPNYDDVPASASVGPISHCLAAHVANLVPARRELFVDPIAMQGVEDGLPSSEATSRRLAAQGLRGHRGTGPKVPIYGVGEQLGDRNEEVTDLEGRRPQVRDLDEAKVLRSLERTDYRGELNTQGRSLGAQLAAQLRDRPPAEEGWVAPNEEAWGSLSLRQRVAAMYVAAGKNTEEVTRILRLRATLLRRWEQDREFREAVGQRRAHPLRWAAESDLEKAYETWRQARLRIAGLGKPISVKGREEHEHDA